MVDDGGGATLYPVLFSDGERESTVGSIKLRPSMEFKKFQETLCAGIGVSPNQITTYLVDHHPKTGERRRVPVTCRADLAVAEKKTNCFFLVVLRRSRRRPRPRQQQQGIGFEYGDVSAPGSYRLLRRDRPDQAAAFRYWDLEVQRENYARMMMMEKAGFGLGLDPGRVGGDGSVGVSPAVGAGAEAFCEECTRATAEGRRTAEFHCCVFDEVVVGIRSKAGPVARPH